MSLEDLKLELAQADSPSILVERAWESSTKNEVARGYIAGLIDALRYTKAVDLEEYNSLYARYVYGS